VVGSTHTPALVSNLTVDEATGLNTVIFESKVRLNPGSYTIIAHTRWIALEGGLRARYDMASES
jgi:hypothetical protein